MISIKNIGYYLFILTSCLWMQMIGLPELTAQENASESIATLISKLRKEARGPYKDIRWFCEDGSIIDPKEKCPGKGNQHARLNDAVSNLASNKKIFLTQILTGTDIHDFWDQPNAQSRMKQYQIEQFLFDMDNGWINEKGQYYRGAKQVEDEMNWGREFFLEILKDKKLLQDKYLLVRRAARDIPHGVDNDDTRNVRALSLELSDMMPKFQNIRIKIHGLPQVTDIPLVQQFKKDQSNKITPKIGAKIDSLLTAMNDLYSKTDTIQIREYLKFVPKVNILDKEIKSYISIFNTGSNSKYLLERSVGLLELIRSEITHISSAKARLDLIDLSNKIEDIILIQSNNWEPKTLEESLDKMCLLNYSLVGGAYIQTWEWAMINEDMPEGKINTRTLEDRIESYRRAIQWGTGMVYSFYKNDVSTFATFEPKAAGFTDDIIRSSPLLAMGHSLDEINAYFADQVKLTNKIFNLKKQSQVKGINPGFAKGILHVIDNFEDNPTLDPQHIYVFNQPPKELKPLAGIATVTEGNIVSHVQLLARNLGIPNAALSLETLNALKKYEGKEVFYAVSIKGTVLMKDAQDMTNEEKALFKTNNTIKDKITIPLDKLILEQTDILNIRNIDATASGKLCGPKAANLAQLKNIFPDMLVEGFVIPFGIYKKHMDQKIPGKSETYWQYIQRVLYYLKDMDKQSISQEALDNIQISMLDSLRNELMSIKFLPKFEKQLRDSFKTILGSEMGTVPVFLRSDTNMEDLKEFTGAGLNLTLFNILESNKITKGIKEVWASPFTERSYKWRQKYLDNPENIYPSILVIPSVDVEKSGVLITKGIANNDKNDLTIAFSQGVGGAVDGQSAETYLAHSGGGYTLLSPSRENVFKAIPYTGGTQSNNKVPGKYINNGADLALIKNVAVEIKKEMPLYQMQGPYDVELGIKDHKIWLFQIRPFVENKSANSSDYLLSISPNIDYGKTIDLNAKLKND